MINKGKKTSYPILYRAFSDLFQRLVSNYLVNQQENRDLNLFLNHLLKPPLLILPV